MEIWQSRLRKETLRHRQLRSVLDEAQADALDLAPRHVASQWLRRPPAVPAGAALEPVEGAARRLRQLREALSDEPEKEVRSQEVVAASPLASDLKKLFHRKTAGFSVEVLSSEADSDDEE